MDTWQNNQADDKPLRGRQNFVYLNKCCPGLGIEEGVHQESTHCRSYWEMVLTGRDDIAMP